MFGFIIPCYINSEKSYKSLNTCVDNIRKYHNEKIVLLNNHSPISIESILDTYDNVETYLSPFPSSGEFNAYLWFHENKIFDKAIVLHDSMYLNKKMENIDKVKTVQFIKYFTDHINDWSLVKEPNTDYNKEHRIATHDDLIIHILNRGLNRVNVEFLAFAKNLYHQKKKWVGCYGIMSIIDYSFLRELQTKTNILDVGKSLTGKRDRIAMESIYSLALLFMESTSINTLKKSYDGPWRIGNTYRPITEKFTKISLGR